jgi:hypothetical protein
MTAPKVFIASSSANLAVARTIAKCLKRIAEPKVWSSFFEARPGRGTFPILLEAVGSQDFGVFVMIGDDRAKMKGKRTLLPRDNVVFELGLFASRIGMERCFIVTDADTHRLSDIHGLNIIEIGERPIGWDAGGRYELALRNAGERIEAALHERVNLALYMSRDTRDAIEQVLDIMLTHFNASSKQRTGMKLRALCHLIDPGRHLLRHFAAVGQSRVDRFVDIPVDDKWWIIGKCFRSRKAICTDVDWEKRRESPVSRDIWKELNAVCAFPIVPLCGEQVALGVLDVNSNKKVRELGWSLREGEWSEFGRNAASAAYHIIKRNLP